MGKCAEFIDFAARHVFFLTEQIFVLTGLSVLSIIYVDLADIGV